MKTLYTEIVIDAEPEAVWDVLVDFARYQEWNPFIVRMSGEAQEGGRLQLRMEPPGGRGASFTPTVTRAEPPRTLEWLGRVGVPGVFDGRHRFELQPAGRGTRVVQREEFRGILVPLMAGSLDRHTGKGFVAMNEALKARVEGTGGPLPA